MFKAYKISQHVYWVGAIDWNIRNFHGYLTSKGTTYNAYLIVSDKVVLIDCVKKAFQNEMLERIASVINPEKIDCIISNHSEMDHSGCLPDVIKIVKPSKIFSSEMGVKTLKEHFNIDNILALKDEEVLNIGKCHMKFLKTSMLHWPESMISYFVEDNMLFSQDAFGMHLASSKRWDKDIDEYILYKEVSKYYANIVVPYSNQVLRLKEKIEKLEDFNIKIIAPDHGPIWKDKVGWIIKCYSNLALQKPSQKAIIVYDTMWHSTEQMVRSIEEGLVSKGINTKVMSLKSNTRTDVAFELLEAGALLIGSPTLNNNMFPTLADVLTYIKGLKFKNKIGFSFGSFGWSGEAVIQINKILTDMGIHLVDEGIKVKYVPNKDDLKKCYDKGVFIAKKIKGES